MDTFQQNFEINGPEQLRYLLSAHAVFRRYMKVTVNLSHMDDDEKKRTESILNRYYNACGCGEGKFFVFLAFVAFIVQAYSSHSLYWSWANVGMGFLYCMAGAFIGKAIGLLLAQIKLRKKVRELLLYYSGVNA